MTRIATTKGDDARRRRRPRTSGTNHKPRAGFFTMLMSLIFKEASATRARNHQWRVEAVRRNRAKRDQAEREWKREQRVMAARMERERQAEERRRRAGERNEPPRANGPQKPVGDRPEDDASVPETEPEQLELDFDDEQSGDDRDPNQQELPLDSFGNNQMQLPGMDD